MAALSPTQVLELIHPALAFLFALTFLCMWVLNRNRPHLILFSLGLSAYALAISSEILLLPADMGFNTMEAATLYVASTLLFSEGMLLRSGQRLGYATQIIVAVVMLGLIYAFYYVRPDLLARIYVLNCGLGLLLLLVALRLRYLATSRLIDRLLFWVFLGFALHFFPRTLLSAHSAVLGDSQIAARNSTFWLLFQFSMVVLGGILVMTLLATSVVDVIDDIRKDRDTDPLTGLLNRRGFELLAATKIGRSDNRPANLIICDIDNFKTINDSYGHAAGDAVLSELGNIMRDTIRDSDIAGRIGGEEFAILLPRCDAAGAHRFAERLRTALMAARFSAIPPSRMITASLGIAQHHHREPLWDLVSRADEQLYAAKHAGKNRTFVDASHGKAAQPAESRTAAKPPYRDPGRLSRPRRSST